MEKIKSFGAFLLAGTIFLSIATGVLFIMDNHLLHNSLLFDISDDSKIVFLGKEIKINEKLTDTAKGYAALCDDLSKLLIPDFFTDEIKSTAKDIPSAVSGVVFDLYDIATEIIYGKM